MRRAGVSILGLLGALVAACESHPSSDERGAEMSAKTPANMTTTTAETTLRVESPAFENEGTIPADYTADGKNVSPPISWSAGPAGTVSYALIVDDPDTPAGTWVHWTLWNLTTTRLDEDAAAPGRGQAGAVSGKNSWRKKGYGGPQPPSGKHRYYFRVYALDTMLDLAGDADRRALDAAMSGHVLASGELMGKYAARK
jgi:Raf kinase inhibitor-like YbhB/YbcL family protein